MCGCCVCNDNAMPCKKEKAHTVWRLLTLKASFWIVADIILKYFFTVIFREKTAWYLVFHMNCLLLPLKPPSALLQKSFSNIFLLLFAEKIRLYISYELTSRQFLWITKSYFLLEKKKKKKKKKKMKNINYLSSAAIQFNNWLKIGCK